MRSAVVVFLALGIVTLHFCFVVGCGPAGSTDKSSAKTQPTPAAQPAGELHLEPRRVEHVAAGCTTPDEDLGCTHLLVETLDVSGDSPAVGAVREWIEDRTLATLEDGGPAASLDSLADNFLEENRTFREEFPDAPGVWAVERRITVLFRSPRILSLVAEDYSYTGGAHPLVLELLASFDLQQGHQLVLADLFKEGSQRSVANLAETELRRVRDLPPDADLEDEGFFLEDGLRLSNNFAVVEGGLRFYYNPYDIGPYVMGPTDLTLSREVLKPWLAEDAPDW